jgi:hypothetical protein
MLNSAVTELQRPSLVHPEAMFLENLVGLFGAQLDWSSPILPSCNPTMERCIPLLEYMARGQNQAEAALEFLSQNL